MIYPNCKIHKMYILYVKFKKNVMKNFLMILLLMFINVNIKANVENNFTAKCKSDFSIELSIIKIIDECYCCKEISGCELYQIIPCVFKTNFNFSANYYSDQQLTSDLYIICQASGDGNLEQVNSRYKLKPNALFLKDGNLNPISAISAFLEEKNCNNLHLYIKVSGNDIMINDFSLNLKNILNYKNELIKWKKRVSGNIIIHNLDIAGRMEIPKIINKIEDITGLKVEILRTY